MKITKYQTLRGKTWLIGSAFAMLFVFSCNALVPVPTPAAPSTATVAVLPTATAQPRQSPTAVVTPALGIRSIWGGAHIAFASNRTGRYQIYLMRPDGSALRQLTDSQGDNHSPAWSADGKHILFVSSRDGNSEIYMMDPNGANQVNLSRDPHSDGMPIWIPPASIAFVSDRQGRERIFVMDSQGTGVKGFRYTSIDSTSHMFCLSGFGDGEIFFTTEESGLRTTHVLDTSNGNVWIPEALAGQPDRSCPSVSAFLNSDWTMFVTNRDGHDEIYGFREKLETDVRFTEGSEPSLGLSRSTDQGWVTYHSKQTGNWDIYILGIVGNNQWNVTNDPADDIQPAWEPY